MEQNKLALTKATEGTCVSVGGGTYRTVMPGKQTGGAYAVIEMLVPPNSGPPPHSHADVQEAFYILEGEIELRTEEGNHIAQKGDYVNIPKGGLVHQFKNKTDTLARLMCIVTPAGMDEMFEEIGEPVEYGQFLPPPELAAKMLKAGEKYGQKFFPPDYLSK
ncbi:cupin domain-containing protein [Mucilaginibacter jinjuensis]|uniref:Cupin domain-containing protein n=1 Tax=Mucilaginibacter jinjuensis TaxID=1176721 RepID=A0ABY7TDX2_9SPHI|nr:cupin domain-containing protein [Mucilaginibacter jinjuensis]WCT14715.1 cupin domain-containing protein [Mucilaginibacter jinjuensis]